VVIWDQEHLWSNAIDLSVQRSMTFAKDIVVVVRSWNSATGRSHTKYSPSGARQSAIASGKAQEFAYVIANLTEAEAQDRANKIRADLTANERLIEFQRPADLTLAPRNVVSLQGTGSSWDQTYFVDSVSRSLGFENGGFTMRVKAKNHDPRSTVTST
jgi:hypothetical protein